ncbi:MAG: NADPH-dependent glutamate synthase [Clostridia bacterium]|nr:NADPH-dependent glutamate synthase [Clostridia bacterium]
MINVKQDRNPMPELEADVRNKNFLEVETGYTEEMAINEAMRCLKCRNKPCVEACPVHNNIPEFIAKVAEGDYFAAREILSETTCLPAVCGRVCPQEKQCEGSCTRGFQGLDHAVGIGRIERFVADWCREHEEHKNEDAPVSHKGPKVAVIGSGPAGIACAGDLLQKSYNVTIFESMHRAGGVLAYGIPQFRLPKDIVDGEIEGLVKKGVKFVQNVEIGVDKTIDDLLEKDGFEAIFIGTGAGVHRLMGIRGEELEGVWAAEEYLANVNFNKAYGEKLEVPQAKHIVVVGGGNVAMDACRTAKRMGADTVTVVYRRSEKEMPARPLELSHAKAEGVEFMYLTNPVGFKADADGKLAQVECVTMELGEPDESGRRTPMPIEGSNFVLQADLVLMALGSDVNQVIVETATGVEANDKGQIIADEKAATTKENVFAGGDAVTGAATVIKAMGAGRLAAKSIDEYFNK